MADTKISDLTEKTTHVGDDLLVIVDSEAFPIETKKARASLLGIPLIARKSADQTLNQSSTTLQNVTEMVFAVGANEVWVFDFFILINSGSTPDFKYGFDLPSGGAVYKIYNWGNLQTFTSIPSANTLTTTGIDQYYRMNLLYIGSSTAGNVQFQAAQNTADASDTKVLANSFIIAHRLA